MTVENDLYAHLAKFETAPFLFVGSGLSRRYLATDDWMGLLRRFAEKTDYPFERYRADASRDTGRMASAIAARFNSTWWESDDYVASRNKFPDPETGQSPLKIEVAKYLAQAVDSVPQSGPLAEELELLKDAIVEGVITTNYDTLLEKLFPTFTVYAGQDELLFNNSYGVGEIFKIHGSAKLPESIILTTEDFLRFNQRNKYLAAKLLTIFVEHPIVFLGYSLSDPNIQEILLNIAEVLTADNLSKLQNRLIFVQWSSEPQAGELIHTFHSVNGNAIPIISVPVSSFEGVFRALRRLKPRLPASVLRRVKEQVYELVSTSESKGTLLVRDIDDDVDPSQVEIVIGVGVRQKLALEGLVGWDRKHVMFETLEHNLAGNREAMETVAREVLPQHLSGTTNCSVYYYLAGAGRLGSLGAVGDSDGLHERVMSRVQSAVAYLRPSNFPRKYRLLAERYETFEALTMDQDRQTSLQVLQVIDLQKVDDEHLRGYLRGNYEETPEGKPTTLWAKAVCIYDAVAFGSLRER
ncbi:SIR2 family protein [Plantibacter sp. CFBP 8775]|uniref:SIR2 family protein n=1 Tax=Plantibacter sp. CFBP 8775 TaxID=2774038 RepID=UPI00177E5CD2|nr:SIR2 family protein [Plantibacter sp. CFBP 8775]MBD8102487.1 SIR2 family protein [Plantibacter sp. CFBP 8775]